MTPEQEHEWRQATSESASLRWHWDGAYEFTWGGGDYHATSADGGGVISGADLFAFKEKVRLDYCRKRSRNARTEGRAP